MLALLFLTFMSFAQEPGTAPPASTPPAEPVSAVEPASPIDGVSSAENDSIEIQRLLEPFLYVVEGKRDPFRIPAGTGPLSVRPVHGPFLKLQQYKLKDFKLKGVLIDAKNPKALLLLTASGPNAPPKPLSIKVRLNQYLGESFGYIAAIRPGKVIIVQTKEQNGQRFSTTKTLTIEK